MSELKPRIVRAKVAISSQFGSIGLIDAITGKAIETVRGNATSWQFTFFEGDNIANLESIVSLNLKIQPAQIPSGTTLADKTINRVDLDLTTTLESWHDGTRQHAEFRFTNSEMNFSVNGRSQEFWLVVSAILASGEKRTLGVSNVLWHQDNSEPAGPPPTNPGAYVTIEEGNNLWLGSNSIHNSSEKPSPNDLDEFAILDSTTGFSIRKLGFGSLCEALKVKLGTFFAKITDLASYVPDSRTVAGKALSNNISLAKADVGLGNVDNTKDADKPVSTQTQSALNGKVDASALSDFPRFSGSSNSWSNATQYTETATFSFHPDSAAAFRYAIGLNDVDNTRDNNKPISVLMAAALGEKAGLDTVNNFTERNTFNGNFNVYTDEIDIVVNTLAIEAEIFGTIQFGGSFSFAYSPAARDSHRTALGIQNTIPVYANDTAADAALQSGQFYRTTAGSRAVFVKP